jgi:hypothetical protein
VTQPIFFDFYEMPPLRAAETLFYRVGLSAEEVLEILDSQLATLLGFARYIATYIASRVLSDEGALTNRPFVESFDLESLTFDPGELRARYEAVARSPERYRWSFDPYVLRKFEAEPRAELVEVGVGPGGGSWKTMPR